MWDEALLDKQAWILPSLVVWTVTSLLKLKLPHLIMLSSLSQGKRNCGKDWSSGRMCILLRAAGAVAPRFGGQAMSHLLSKNLLLRSTLAMLPDDSASFRHSRIAVWESVSVSMIWRCLWLSTPSTTKWQYVLYSYCIPTHRIWSSRGQRLVSVQGWQSLRRTKTFVCLGQQCVLGMVKLTRICCSICWHILTFPELAGWLFSRCPKSLFLILLYWQSMSGCQADFTFWLYDVLSSMVKWEMNEEFMALLHNGLCCEQKSIRLPPPPTPRFHPCPGWQIN